MAAKKSKKKTKGQTEIPGTERPVFSDVAKKAAELYEVRAERMELSEREGELANALLALMKKRGVTEYTEEDMTVTIVSVEERVRVKRKAAE